VYIEAEFKSSESGSIKCGDPLKTQRAIKLKLG